LDPEALGLSRRSPLCKTVLTASNDLSGRICFCSESFIGPPPRVCFSWLCRFWFWLKLLTIRLHRLQPRALNQTTEGIQKRWNEFGVWGGISFNAPTLIGKTPDARFGNIGLRYGRVLAASKTVAFEWTIDAIPVALLSNNRFNVVPSGTGFIFTQTRKSVYAWGLAPIGLKFNFRRNRRVQPFAQTTGGFLYFNEQVPVAGAARFNFTFDFSGGVQIVNTNRRAFTIGYKYQHISNGFRATFQPGRGCADDLRGVFGV